jgi:Tol biopolymer transport system component
MSRDPLRKQRFEREAKTISNLNHPHICVLYDVGSQDELSYLVMECLEGETLAKRLEKGPLPLEQVLKYGAQIADALDKAHRCGVVHRDLKPANVMLTQSGAKLLDFGLAKPATSPNGTGGITLSAVAPCSSPETVTHEGTIVGTFQYMSPEQIEGKDVDGRGDIFSLGAVLYEMLSGQRAFPGKSQLSVASAILEREPVALSAVRPMTPPALDHAIRRCLMKDPEERWQTARDLALELKWISEAGSQPGAVAVSGGRKSSIREWLGWLAAAVLLGELVFGLTKLAHAPAARDVLRYTVAAPGDGRFLFGGFREGPAISPDGKRIAFLARTRGVEQIWVKSSDSLTPRALEGTEGVISRAFWSPDSQNIAFVSGGALKRVSANGGPTRTICITDGLIRGGTWSQRDVILFGTSPGPIYQVPASGGTPKRLTSLDAERQDLLHRWPFFLPDGNHFLYSAGPTVSFHESNVVMVGSLDGKEERVLFHASSPVAYANGYLLYLSGTTLMARPFDPTDLEFTGEAASIAEQVWIDPFFGGSTFSASNRGDLVYQQGEPFQGYSLKVLDRSGKQTASLDEPQLYFYLRMSPDGKQIAYHSPDAQSGKFNIFVWDIASGRRIRITYNSAFYNRGPLWSPDGTKLAFAQTQGGNARIFVKALNSLGAEEKIADLGESKPVMSQWTPDGKYLLFDDLTADTRRQHIVKLAVDGQSAPETLLESADASVASGAVSPDERWLAYRSTETGRSEVYLTTYPKPVGRIQVSSGGGGAPRWRHDGKELYFMGPNHQLMAAELKEGEGSMQVVSLKSLFSAKAYASASTAHYDVAADGSRFAILSISADETAAPINVVVNWDAELKKK